MRCSSGKSRTTPVCSLGRALCAATALGALAPVAVAGADDRPVLGVRGVEGVAQRAAKQWGERHPLRLEYVSASLDAANKVLAGERVDATAAPPDASAGTGAPSSLVDVIVVWGRFTANGSPPRHAKAQTGRALALIVDAHTGFVEVRSLRRSKGVPLARLGTVRRIRLGSGG